MKHVLALLLGVLVCAAASAEPAAASLKKVAVISLIGDEMTIDTYRRRVGTGVDVNHQEVIALPTPVFDHAALFAAEDALVRLLPAASIAPLAVPAAGSDSDPARVVEDGKVSPTNPLIATLRQGGFTHLLTIAKHRAPARLQLAGSTVGSGYLKGLGFYIDNHLPTLIRDTNERGQGFVAPYVYVRLALIDLASLDLRGEQTITASTTRSAASNKTGFDAWGAMTADEKLSVLKWLIEERIAGAVPELLRAK